MSGFIAKKQLFACLCLRIPNLAFLVHLCALFWASGLSCLHIFVRSSSSALNINLIFLKKHQEIYICHYSCINNLLAELTGIMSSSPVIDTQVRHSKVKYSFRQSLVRFLSTGSFLIAMIYNRAHMYIRLLHKEP
jgi:hypothetical protein